MKISYRRLTKVGHQGIPACFSVRYLQEWFSRDLVRWKRTNILKRLLAAVTFILLHVTNINCPTTWRCVAYLVTIDR